MIIDYNIYQEFLYLLNSVQCDFKVIQNRINYFIFFQMTVYFISKNSLPTIESNKKSKV